MNKILSFLKKYRHYVIAVLIVACFVSFDLISKQVVKDNVEYGLTPGVEVISRFFYITYSENFGAANGSFTGYTTILIIVSVIALGIFGYLAKDINFTKKRLYSWSICLIIAGTLGNLINRIFNGGGVIDFLSFYPLGMGNDWFINRWSLDPWPTFNIADSLLVIGVIAFAVHTLFFEQNDKPKKDKNTPNVPEDELIEEDNNGNN